jgi:N-acetylneuraminic acid mutarotase
MRVRLPVVLVPVLVPALFPGPATGAADLTFQDRVAAQTAIERVYHAHRIGETRRFEDAVPPQVIEAKVRAYLKLSVALEQRWKAPVTAEALSLEVKRMENNSFLPDRLREIEATLGNDPHLIRECLARPPLVERLVLTQIFYGQPAPKTDTWIAYDEWWLRSAPRLDEMQFVEPESAKTGEKPTEGPAARTPAPAPTAARSDSWRVLSNGYLHPTIRSAHSAVWTGTHMIIWGGGELGRPVKTGGLYDPATDTWSHVSTIEAPTARSGHAAVWTGTQMLVWGGDEQARGGTATGGLYDPMLNTWQPISLTRAPAGGEGATVVWTGREMVVWGGRSPKGSLDTGGRYDPAADHWSPISTLIAPSGRQRHSAVWTGKRMIVWGGIGADRRALNSGGSYDPARDTWSRISSRDGPGARVGHTAVWAGNRMIVWGGVRYQDPDAKTLDTGGCYDPVDDAWSPTSPTHAPAGRTDAAAVWTGSQMIVWGGSSGAGGQRRGLNSGGRYDPVADTWATTSVIDALSGRSPVSALWIGNTVLFWGGHTKDMFELLSRSAYVPPAAGDPGPAAPSAGPPPGRPYQLPPDVVEYFNARYEKIDSKRSNSSLIGTPDGPSGSLELTGRMMPKGNRGGATQGERALATARAFLEEEAFFLDIPDQAELLAGGVDWKSPGVASINFIRRIGGLELQRMYINVDVEADGPITHFRALLRPVPEQLYTEVRQDFLSDARVIEIVRGDMAPGAHNEPPPVALASLYPETEPPAVIREARAYLGGLSSCGYLINAVTGAIIKKDCHQ